MLLGLITFSAVSYFVFQELFSKPKSKTPEEKLGDAVAGYLKSIKPKEDK